MRARPNGVSRVLNAAMLVACLCVARNALAREEFQRGSTEVTTVAGKTLTFMKARFSPRDQTSALPAGNGLAVYLETGWGYRLHLECIRSIRLRGDSRKMDVEYVFQGKTNTLSGTYNSDIDDPTPAFEGENAFGTQQFRLSELASIRFLDTATNTDVIDPNGDWRDAIAKNYGADTTLKGGKTIRVCDLNFASGESRTWKSAVFVPGIPGAYENKHWSGLARQSDIYYRLEGKVQKIDTIKLRQLEVTEDGGLRLTSEVDGSLMSISHADLCTVGIIGRIDGYFSIFVPMEEIERLTIACEWRDKHLKR